MPQKIALIIFIAVILFLLRLDRLQYPKSSLALWLPTLWILIAMSKPLGIWFGANSTTMEDGSALDRNFLILLLIIGFVIIKNRNVNIAEVLRQNSSAFILLGFMFVSISWSDMPFVSLKRWIKSFVPIVMALIIASEDDPKEAMQCIFRRAIYVLIPLSVMLIKYFPHLGRDYGRWSGALMWIGVCSQKNGLASLCMFTLTFFSWNLIRRGKGFNKPVVWYQKYIEIFLVLLSIHLFIGPTRTLTYSATAMAALSIALMSLFGFSWLNKHYNISRSIMLPVLIIVIIGYGTFTPFVGGFTFIDPSAALNRESTLTGRNHIWEDLVPYAMQNPALGHGFGGFWTEAIRDSVYEYPAHNGYLETILATGFIGLFLLSTFLISNCRKAQNLMNRDFDWGIYWFSLLLVAVSRNITESSVMSFSDFWLAIQLFFMISSSSNLSYS